MKREWLWLALLAMLLAVFPCPAQTTNNIPGAKRILMLFSEARDLPGNVLMDQGVRNEMLSHGTNPIEFYTESMDASQFHDPTHFKLFGEYIKNKYAGQKIDLVMMFMARNLMLARVVETALPTNIPSVFVAINDMDNVGMPADRPSTGIYQRADILGTLNFIFRLQPEIRRVVIIGGVSSGDLMTLGRIADATRSIEGVKFNFLTNMPVAELTRAVGTFGQDTAVLLGPVQRDITGQQFYTAQVAQMLAPRASVPVYVMGASLVGSGAVGGCVVDSERLGAGAGDLALRVLEGTPVSQLPIQELAEGTPMVDWRVLERWGIKPSRLPSGCVTRYRPTSLWEEHRVLIICVATGLLAQAITIVGLLAQRRLHQRAEAQIERQRTELAHVTRVSTMGQLATALTHELNQPLGAILRNAEAAEIFLQNNPPNLEEVRAILTDIRRDDKRAGNVIDRMRALYKRRSLALNPLHLGELVEDTLTLTRADAAAREVKLMAQIPVQLPEVRGDRVHLQQVLLNLILNGMDAMTAIPKTRRSLVVRVSETKIGNLRVEVIDQGAGIAPDDAVRIFEPFFTTKLNGMGMGLAISQTIIEAHGGEIWVDSRPAEGTTFSFILPPNGLDKVKEGDLPADL